MRNPDYDVLLEPVVIGPKKAKNRFYQVPHCNGMGYALPRTHAGMREMKAEGGWAIVCTEYCSIHPSSDDHPYPYAALWDDDDVRAYALMVDKVHRHGALAGVQLWYGGCYVSNLTSSFTPSIGYVDLSIYYTRNSNKWEKLHRRLVLACFQRLL